VKHSPTELLPDKLINWHSGYPQRCAFPFYILFGCNSTCRALTSDPHLKRKLSFIQEQESNKSKEKINY
jgi:hypothetical protein